MTDTSETKLELLAESIEAMTLAQVVATSPACSDHEREIAMKNVVDAREALRKALRGFLVPTLRVVETAETRKASLPYGAKASTECTSPKRSPT